jgi:hypothetical protein
MADEITAAARDAARMAQDAARTAAEAADSAARAAVTSASDRRDVASRAALLAREAAEQAREAADEARDRPGRIPPSRTLPTARESGLLTGFVRSVQAQAAFTRGRRHYEARNHQGAREAL